MQGKRRQLPVGDILVPSIRITAVYDDELTAQLKDSLNAAGQIVPIIVVENDGTFDLVDGLHRLEEAIARGDRSIDSIVVPGDSITTLTYNLLTNNMRGKVRASEMVTVIGELTNTHGLDSDEIAQRTGLTRNYIEKLWRIAEASPMLQDALDKSLIGVGVAYEVSRLPHIDQQEEVMSTVYTFHMTTKQAKEFVDSILIVPEPQQSQEPQPQPEPPPPPTCDVCRKPAAANLLVQVQLDPGCFHRVGILAAQQEPSPIHEVENVAELGDA